ncbi:MAG: ribonuclease E activity regulator RraA [Gammaproteobacteria bacterium]
MTESVAFATADLYDANEDKVQVALPMFADFGGRLTFSGPISTVKVHEDNTLVRKALEEPGKGRVLIVDGGESLRCALVGDMLAELGAKNDWAGIIVSGCIRDSAVITTIDIGVKALGTNPRKSVKLNTGQRDIPVHFADVTFTPGAYVYADDDGILVSKGKLV